MFKSQIKNKKSKKTILVVTGILVTATAALSLTIISNHKDDEAVAAIPIVKPAASMFSFDATKALDWKLGPTNETSTALFYKKSDCFTSIAYLPGNVDDSALNAQAIATMKDQGNSSVSVTDQELSLKFNNQNLPYVLHQYRSQGGNSQYYQFQEAAYINKGSNYFSITGNCKFGSDLDATITGLNAISVSFKP